MRRASGTNPIAAALLAAGLLTAPGAGTAPAPETAGQPSGRTVVPTSERAGEQSPGSKFRLAVPPYEFRFPRDHAAHPEFQTEWWYYTGHLYSGARKFGYELTFFQVGIDAERKNSRSAWALHTLYFAHLTLTNENDRTFRFTETVSRPALGMAGARTDLYHLWIHEWSARLLTDDRTHHLQAAAPEFAIDLELFEAKPPVIHGFNGVSRKSAGVGRASHYYSCTRMETRGTLTVKGEKLPVTGLSWMDREFGSNQLTPEQAGWDWFSIQLDNRRELMLYVLRLKDGGIEPASSGTIVNADGSWKHLPLSAFRIESTDTWKSPKTGGVYPAAWTIHLPGEAINLRLQPTLADQELVTEGMGVHYWEGAVRVEGTDQGRPVRGVGYVELTGYVGSTPGI